MNRALNLDTVAPDDPIPETTTKPVANSNPLPKISQVIPEPQVQPQAQPNIATNNSIDTLWEKWYSILGHTQSPLSSFLVHPKVFTFEEKEDDENIVLVLRPHWFTNVHWILITIFMIFVPSLLSIVPLLGGFPLRFQFAAIVFWYLVTFMFAFVNIHTSSVTRKG